MILIKVTAKPISLCFQSASPRRAAGCRNFHRKVRSTHTRIGFSLPSPRLRGRRGIAGRSPKTMQGYGYRRLPDFSRKSPKIRSNKNLSISCLQLQSCHLGIVLQAPLRRQARGRSRFPGKVPKTKIIRIHISFTPAPPFRGKRRDARRPGTSFCHELFPRCHLRRSVRGAGRNR